MFKRVLGSLLCAVSVSAWANTSCPPVSCDCASIPDPAWRAECQQQELKSNLACANGQQPQACLVTGPGALSSELWVANVQKQPTVDPKATIKQGQLLSWGVREAGTQALLAQERGNWKGAIAQRNREARGQQQIYQLALGLAEYYDAKGQTKDREALFADLIERNLADAERIARAAESLWQGIPGSPAGEVAVKQALAQRMMRNASDFMAQAADAARRNGDPGESAKLWQRTAELSVQLLGWAEMAGGSAKAQNLYRQRAAARWYQAGLMALVGGDAEAASAAKRRSEALRPAGS